MVTTLPSGRVRTGGVSNSFLQPMAVARSKGRASRAMRWMGVMRCMSGLSEAEGDHGEVSAAVHVAELWRELVDLHGHIAQLLVAAGDQIGIVQHIAHRKVEADAVIVLQPPALGEEE